MAPPAAVSGATPGGREQGGSAPPSLVRGKWITRPGVRFAAAAIVMLGEYLAISLRFDAATVALRGGPWKAAAEVGAIAPLAVVVATALVLFRPRATAASFAPRLGPLRLAFSIAHIAALAAFYATTVALFDSASPPAGPALLWLGLWGALGLGVAGTLMAFAGFRSLGGLPLRGAALAGLGALVVGVAAWGAGNFTLGYWEPLSRATLIVVEHVLRVVLPGRVFSEPAELVIGLSDFAVTIAPSCSGFEGMGLIAALFVGYLFAFRSSLRFPNALLLLPAGIACVWLGNALRIAGLLVVGAYVDADLAYGGFHSKAGWVFFCAVALGLGALGQRLRFFTRDAAPRDQLSENPTAAYLMPLLMLIGVALVTAAFTRDVDLFYGARLLAALLALIAYRRWYRTLDVGASAEAVLIGLAVGAAWVATHPHDAGAASTLHAAFATLPGWALAAWIAVRALGSVVVIPVCEELAFRGWLLRWLISRDFTSVSPKAWTLFAVVGSSLAFGALHHRWAAAALAGAAYAFVQHRSGRLSDAVVAHAVTNGAIAAWALATGDYGLWL